MTNSIILNQVHITWREAAKASKGKALPIASSFGRSKAKRVSFKGFNREGSLAAKGPKWEQATLKAAL